MSVAGRLRYPRPRASQKRRLVAFVGAAVVLLAGCGSEQGDSSDDSQGGGSQYVKGTGEISRVPQKKRKPAPDITAKTVDGDTVSLSDYRGKVLVLNVWGSWCPPCRAEAPHFARVSKQTKDQGVRFLGINTRDHTTAARSYERNYHITYPSLRDDNGKLLLKFQGDLSPQAIPSTLVIDRQGRVAARALKSLTDTELKKMLKPVMAEGSSSASPAKNARATHG